MVGERLENPRFTIDLWLREGGISERDRDIHVRTRQTEWGSEGGGGKLEKIESEREGEKQALIFLIKLYHTIFFNPRNYISFVR